MAHDASSDLLAVQRELNERTEQCWEGYTLHRAQVTGRLLRQASKSSRLLVLGAGNCNDLDLPAIVSAFGEVVLLDLDGEALTRGQQRQFAGAASPCTLVAGEEITRFLPEYLAANQAERQGLIASLLGGRIPPPDLGLGRFEVVASVCLLSQIINGAISVIQQNAPLQAAISTALRRQHLQLLSSLLKPGGRGILFSDFVSSDTAPELVAEAVSDDMRLVARRLLEAGNFFLGSHPGHLMQDLTAMGGLSVELSAPWVWQMGTRRFLVLAAEFDGP